MFGYECTDGTHEDFFFLVAWIDDGKGFAPPIRRLHDESKGGIDLRYGTLDVGLHVEGKPVACAGQMVECDPSLVNEHPLLRGKRPDAVDQDPGGDEAGVGRWPAQEYAHRGVDDQLLGQVGREVEREDVVRVASENWRR